VMGFEWGLVGAAGLAVVNTLVGVLAHQGVLWVVSDVDPMIVVGSGRCGL